jgi:hypothetical protein
MNKTPIVYQRPYVEGTHYPEGIFIANGPGIQQGVTLSNFPIINTAPCLIYSLGLEIPSDFEGGLPDGIFEESFVNKHSYRIGKPTLTPESYAFEEVRDTDKNEEEEIYKRLKALGYIE